MKRVISKCPSCQETLHICTLRCPDCGMELKSDFSLSPFDRLDSQQYAFLLAFLANRGNLKDVQAQLQLSYPAAKKKLDDLLAALGLDAEPEAEAPKVLNIDNLSVDHSSTKASEIVKAKLKENGGHITVYTARGLPCEIYAQADGKTFTSNKLPNPPYEYAVFDVVTDLLAAQGGRAKKGNGRNFKLGEPGCEENTVVGAIAKYRGRKAGESVFDPVFLIAAVLEWAGIAENGRGELILNEQV